MKNDHFRKTKSIFKGAIQRILAVENNLLLDEAALPAYVHKNPLIDYLFWKRLKVVYDFIRQKYKGQIQILDFGCGTGVMSYLLAKDHIIWANDIEFAPLRIIQKEIQFPEEVQFVEGDLTKIYDLPKFDVILALDVLEHMREREIEQYFHKFMSLLDSKGVLLISGPTENKLYEIGRKLAGKRFTGDYHSNNIVNIIRQLNTFAEVEILADLVWPVSLFKVIQIRKGSEKKSN